MVAAQLQVIMIEDHQNHLSQLSLHAKWFKQPLDHEVRVSMSLSPTIQFLAYARRPARLNPQNEIKKEAKEKYDHSILMLISSNQTYPNSLLDSLFSISKVPFEGTKPSIYRLATLFPKLK